MESPSQLSQSAEEEELINEVVDRTPDTSSDLPSSLEKRPFLSSDEEDTGDSDDEESDFEEPIFTPPKKKRGFQWHKIEVSGKKAIESFVRGHSWYSPLRNGVVRKCVAHRDCEHYVKLLTNGELYERGAHSTSPNINVSTLRGISPLIIDEVDEKLRGGLKPTFIHNFYKNHDDYKSIAPTVIQISNRKKFLNKSSIKVDTVKQLQSYLLSKTVPITELTCHDIMTCPDEESSTMIVLKTFQQECRDDDGNPLMCDGWIFSCNHELENFLAVLQAHKETGLCLSVDSTYKVTNNGWALTALIADNLIESRGENHLSRKPVPLFHACSRTEASPVFVALFTVVKDVAKQLGYPNTHIQCCGMDHCKASLNGLLDVEPSATPVDCNIHVLRGMARNKYRLVDKLYLDTALSHVKMLRVISDRRLFILLRDAVIREWKNKGEDDYADWFSKVYLAEEWNGGTFNVGASGIPGYAPQNNTSESLFRSIKLQIQERAVMSHFLEVSIPAMLKHLREQYRVSRINFLCSDQLSYLQHGHVHRDCLTGACAIVDPGPQNCKRMDVIVQGKNEVHWYVNSKRNLFIEHTRENRMCKSYIDMFHSVKRKDRLSLGECRERFLSMYVVREVPYKVKRRTCTSLVCSCPRFWDNGRYCPHSLAVHHLRGDIDVKHMSSSIRPARKRGRPRNAAKALINDESIDVMALKPGNWKNTYVRHPQYLNGMCVDYRVVPNHKNEKLLRWQCRFSDALMTYFHTLRLLGSMSMK